MYGWMIRATSFVFQAAPAVVVVSTFFLAFALAFTATFFKAPFFAGCGVEAAAAKPS